MGCLNEQYKMKNKIEEIKRNGVPVVKSGSAKNGKEFFDLVIKDQFSAVEEIKSIHKALIQYVNREDVVFVLRLFGSYPRKNYENLRRGFLTHYPNGRKMVFCDNTFAMSFAAMKLAGKSYTTDELVTYMNDTSTRFGFGSTKEERELAYYQWTANRANINLNSYGWYLAHIVPVGKDYSNKRLRNFFDNPKLEEWRCSPDHIRRVKNVLTPQELSILKAHFLRMIHPLNSFLVPKPSLLAYNGKNIGEEPELINIVQDYIKNEYSEEYEELSLLMQVPNVEKTVNVIGPIVWNNNNKEKEIISPKQTTAKPKQEKYKCLLKQDEEQKLSKTLKSIGKEMFVELYPLVKGNPLITIEDVVKRIPKYGEFSENSKKSRLSNIKGIIRRGLGNKALENILVSNHIDGALRYKAAKLIATD